MIIHYCHLGNGVLKMLARRAGITILYEGVDITAYIQKDLLNFKYTDNASDNADDISITLKDENAKWLNYWFPEKGDSISSVINIANWNKNGEKRSLNCGSFIIDEPEYSGRPRILTINAASTPSNTDFTGTKKSRAWENIKLSSIAKDISDGAGLYLFFDSDDDPVYQRQDQSEKSDMTFLSELCKNEGLGFKVTDNKVIIFNEAQYESLPSIINLSESSGMINSYSFKTSFTSTGYAGCRIKYRNAKTNATIEYLYAIKDIEDDDKIYEMNEYVTSLEEAKRRAQMQLRALNKKEWTASLNVIGDIRLVGGVNVNIDGFGKFDGKYFIDKATHNLPGYNVDLEMHRVLEGY